MKSFGKKSYKSFRNGKDSPLMDRKFSVTHINGFQLSLGQVSIEGRNHENEDRYFAVEDLCFVPNMPPQTSINTIGYFGVFDGHGGTGCSTFLSKVLHEKIILSKGFFSSPFTLDRAEAVLIDAYKEASDQWEEIAESTEDFSGSCAVTALVCGGDIVIAHAGDCRAVMREGKTTSVLTKDHRPSDPEEKARIRAAGGFIKAGRVMGVLAPSRGFGDLDVKRSAPSPDVVISEPDVIQITLPDNMPKQPGHTFCVLATDGVWDAVKNDKACDIVARSLLKHDDPNRAAQKLADYAADLNSDDVTVVVITWTCAGTNIEDMKNKAKSKKFRS